MINITYGRSNDAWQDFNKTLKQLIEKNSFKRICEVGGGANPSLSIEYVLANDIDYTLLDISSEELEKAPPGYGKIVADICEKNELNVPGKFDLLFSKMLMEHIVDAKAFHGNIYKLLISDGLAFHFFPTLYAPPFLTNRLVPQAISSLLLDVFAPRDRIKLGKFPAKYIWCLGPTMRQIRRLEKLNYTIIEYRGFFGHGYYKKIPIIKKAHTMLTNFLVRHPLPYLTSYAYLILKKTTSYL